jgi:hypothetical protein
MKDWRTRTPLQTEDGSICLRKDNMSRLQLMSEINDLNHLDDQVPVETDDEKKKIPHCRNSSKIE